MLEHLRPEAVFRFFEALSAIPHGSRHTETISDFCAAFAQSYKLEHWQDAAHNVVIVAPPSPGYERAPTLILQGHLDMVCEKESWCNLNMERDPLELRLDGDFISANGTTLGGDDGIAIAMMLSILQEPSIPHPRLECVMTTDEEIGMLGAAAFDASRLRGKRMINLDSEAEGVFTVGCAGGCTAVCALPPRWESASGAALHISVRGLTGGHSGMEIHRGRANANVVLGRVLRQAAANDPSLRLVRADGGMKDNAIPVAAEAEVVTAHPDAVRDAVNAFAGTLRHEFRDTDPNLTVEVSDSIAVMCMDEPFTKRLIRFLTAAPNGVQSMNPDLPSLVQTSLNLGILRTEPQAVTVSYCVRSSHPGEKAALLDRLRALTEPVDNGGRLSGQLRVSGDYPAWAYRPQSPLRDLCADVFRQLYRTEPKVEAVHAGLECGYFADKIPGLDCVSIGPDLLDIHTPRERMRVSSVQRVWRFLLEVLRRAT